MTLKEVQYVLERSITCEVYCSGWLKGWHYATVTSINGTRVVLNCLVPGTIGGVSVNIFGEADIKQFIRFQVSDI